ncbi:hypothetical protein, partial [Acinetobacter junii]|uniref:hypothetical protein n=1 Tax=Acinetobacter junii TaxID=40215 RepID=UPI00148F3C51
DMIYFADLGGQMFRVDLNNAAQTSTATDVNVGVRVKRIADLSLTEPRARGLSKHTWHEIPCPVCMVRA